MGVEVGGEAMGDREVTEAFRERWDWFALISHVEIQTLFEGIPAISAMNPDKRMLVPQEEISGEEAMVERGAIEIVGAEVEIEAAMVEREVIMTGTEKIALEGTEAVVMEIREAMVGTEEAAVKTEVGVAMVETGVMEAMEETKVAMEAKWRKK